MISVSSSLEKLFKKKSLIRSVQAPEKMARCTDICVETTGCLTDAKINLEQILLGEDLVFRVEDTKKLIQHKSARRLIEAVLYSSSCFYELVNEREHKVGGQETEIGLINLLREFMRRWVYEAQIQEILDENKEWSQVPFNSENKWMAVVVERQIC
jgi:magnesium-transporting ATPase (P-type)